MVCVQTSITFQEVCQFKYTLQSLAWCLMPFLRPDGEAEVSLLMLLGEFVLKRRPEAVESH